MTSTRAAALPRLMLVTDPAFGDDAIVRCVRRMGAAVGTGVFGVQLRDKSRWIPSLRQFASRMRLVTRKAGGALFVNGHSLSAIHIARDVDADGVHLGGGAGSVSAARAIMKEGTWISVAAHGDDEVRRAGAEGANAVFVSPIFATRSPRQVTPKVARGLAALRSARACARPGLFLYALGGITPETVAECAAAGADGVAVIRALLASQHPDEVARAIDDVFRRR